MNICRWRNEIFASSVVLGVLCFPQVGFGQNAIAPDATLPNNTLVNFNNKTYTITGGTQVGTTQFHSFQDFSVPSRNTAHFNNALTTENVIGRVTGANISNIEGVLKTNGATNLYLINPNGVIFGANAELKIGGAFSASTANSIKFSDGSEFSATDPQAPPSLLNVNVPLGLQYGASNPSATIVNRGNLAVGQDLVLNADNLDLQGTLQAGGNLTLQAQDTVLIRNASFNPFTAIAGRNLLVQGNQSIDIFTLRDPNSIFESGGDLVLRSLNPIFADTNFSSAGNFTVEQLDGTSNNLLSRNGGVIFANGDVSLADYYGGSLHILAGGSVTLGDIFITNTGAQDTTINPSNSTLFNANKTYADLSGFYLTDYQATKNSDGSVKDVSPVQTLITIDGSTQATLDIRAGIDWGKLGGLPTSPTSLGIVKPAPTYTNAPTNADINVNGNIRISQPNGLVLLTNQFKPNALQGAIAINGDIDVSTVDTVANGGDIRVYGKGDITISAGLSDNAIALSTLSRSDIGDSGNGGNISISSNYGNITLFNTFLNTYSFSSAGNSGHGGRIHASTNSGNIILGAAGLDSSSSISTSDSIGDAGNGGDIALVSRSGRITLQFNNFASEFTLNSKSQSNSGNSSNGGAISLVSLLGDIELLEFQSLNASSESFSGNASKGGAISLATSAGNIAITASTLTSFSKSNNMRQDDGTVVTSDAGNGGSINLIADRGNIDIKASTFDSTSISDADAGITHNGGTISFSANSGNIVATDSLFNSFSSSATGKAGDGSAISFSTNSGEIALSFSTINTYSFSGNVNAGDGGTISFTSKTGNINLYNLALSTYSNANSTISSTFGNAGNGGAISFTSDTADITLTNSSLDSSSFLSDGNTGNGGAISFKSNLGSITLNDSGLNTIASAFGGNTGNGGAISLNANHDITLDNSFLYSFSFARSFGGSSDGGTISVISKSGNITLNNSALYSFSYSGDYIAGNAGDIFLSAPKGSITRDPLSNSTPSSLVAVSISDALLLSGNGGKVTLEAKNQLNNLEIFTLASSGEAGKLNVYGFGNLAIANLKISTSSQVSVPDPKDFSKKITFNTAKRSGDVLVNGLGDLTFSQTALNSATQGDAPAGNISITSPSAIAFQNSQILSSTNSIGNAGIISIQAERSITIQDNTEISAKTSGLISNAGKAGDILLKAPIVTITGGSQVLAETNGNGAGGNVAINAPTSVSLMRVENAFPVLSVQTSNAGKAGNILIDTPILTLSDQARITATATATSTNKDGGGSITLNASSMNLFGTVGVFAETKGVAPAGTLFLNPYNNDSRLNIALVPNSQISASTSGSGNGGSIFVAAPEAIAITGQGKLAVETSGTGNAGNIRFTTGNLTLSDGVLVSASTSGAGKAGDISIQANNIALSNGASIQTTTSSTGDSGKIEAIASNSFVITGTNTGLFANTEKDSTGKGGNIFIDPPLVSITNGAGISVNSLGKGNGGNIDIFAGKFVFANNAFLLANTASGEGGNINLQIADIFFPRNSSNITATAGGTGNGGNINLSSLFTIAVPSENSDIFANAFFGKGGNIDITTQGILGLAFRPRLTDFSDITASSEFGLQGNVNINTPGVDPSKGLANLPANVSDPSRLISQSCIADHRGSEFIITGKGGLPAKPSDHPIYATVLDNLGTLPNHSQTANLNSPILEPKINSDAIVEATGWIVNDKNEIVLVAGVVPAQARIPCAQNK